MVIYSKVGAKQAPIYDLSYNVIFNALKRNKSQSHQCFSAIFTA